MTKIKFVLPILLVAFLLASCGGSDTPTTFSGGPNQPGDDQTGDTGGGGDDPPGDVGGEVPGDDQTGDTGGGDVPDIPDEPIPVDPNLGPLPGISDFLDGGSTGGDFLDVEDFPRSQIFSGGPPKDGIPALNNPDFVSATDAFFLSDFDFVFGVFINGEAKAYPHAAGWWHEIVNDVVGGVPISQTLCPLTGTGLVFRTADDDGSQFELGVSGLLFNSNLIMYDRRDNTTLYPQMSFTGIDGNFFGESLELMPVVETTWGMWKKLYPSTSVLDLSSTGVYGLSRYGSYPYGSYREAGWFLFEPRTLSSNPLRNLFSVKDRVLGIRSGGVPKAYPFASLGDKNVINDTVEGKDLVVVWDNDARLAIPYERDVEGRTLTFQIDLESNSGKLPFNMTDQETGTIWNIKGVAIDGELSGSRLKQIPAYNSMWFAWITFWQNTEIWEN